MKQLILASLLIAIAGCGTVSKSERGELNQAAATFEYGEEPTPAAIEAAIRERMVTYLKDPASAQYQLGKPTKGWMKGNPLAGGKVAYGWQVKALINSKNSYGGYTGFQEYLFLIHAGKVIDAARGFDGHWLPL